MGHAWNTHGTRMEHVWNTYRTRMKGIQNAYGDTEGKETVLL